MRIRWKRIDTLILLVFAAGALFGKVALEEVDLGGHPFLGDWLWRTLIITAMAILVYEFREHYLEIEGKP